MNTQNLFLHPMNPTMILEIFSHTTKIHSVSKIEAIIHHQVMMAMKSILFINPLINQISKPSMIMPKNCQLLPNNRNINIQQKYKIQLFKCKRSLSMFRASSPSMQSKLKISSHNRNNTIRQDFSKSKN